MTDTELCPAAASVASAPECTATVTTARGERVEYTASWAAYPLPGTGGKADAEISATSYVAPGGAGRPVTFLFNGGPGASSSPLHMRGVGPRRLVAGADGPGGLQVIAPNPHTLLDCSDLVFIDPPGTGFSRELQPGGAARYWSVKADAASAEHLIRQWLTDHDRGDSPVCIVGESYGGFRLATMCAGIADLPIAGLVFISPMLDASASAHAPGNDLPYVLALPTMAVAAWAHGRASAGAADAADVFASAAAFVADHYVRALHLGSQLREPERSRIAGDLAGLIGLPVAQVLDADLRVSGDDFQRSLLADRAELIGRLDTRVTGPVPPAFDDGRPLAAADPALGMGTSNVKHSAEIAAYLREQAGAGAEGPYVSLSLDISFGFDFRSADSRPGYESAAHFYRNPTANVAGLLEARPDARVLVLGGYYDLATPLLGSIHAITHSGIAADRAEVLPVDAGHSLEPAVLPAAVSAMRRLIGQC